MIAGVWAVSACIIQGRNDERGFSPSQVDLVAVSSNQPEMVVVCAVTAGGGGHAGGWISSPKRESWRGGGQEEGQVGGRAAWLGRDGGWAALQRAIVETAA